MQLLDAKYKLMLWKNKLMPSMVKLSKEKSVIIKLLLEIFYINGESNDQLKCETDSDRKIVLKQHSNKRKEPQS